MLARSLWSVAAVPSQQQSRAVATEATGPAKPQMFPLSPFTEKVCRPRVGRGDSPEVQSLAFRVTMKDSEGEEDEEPGGLRGWAGLGKAGEGRPAQVTPPWTAREVGG